MSCNWVQPGQDILLQNVVILFFLLTAYSRVSVVRALRENGLLTLIIWRQFQGMFRAPLCTSLVISLYWALYSTHMPRLCASFCSIRMCWSVLTLNILLATLWFIISPCYSHTHWTIDDQFPDKKGEFQDEFSQFSNIHKSTSSERTF